MDYEKFHRLYVLNLQKGQRKGQAMMNALAQTDMTLHDMVMFVYPEADCFYNDEKVSAFLALFFPIYRPSGFKD